MPSFLAAHGYDPGPVQRPVLTGAVAGLLGTVPATLVLWAFGSLEVEADILGLAMWQTLAAGAIAMTVCGGLYGALFQRAANDGRGGWLFGMSFGFVLWTGGAVLLLPVFSNGRAPAGVAAIGLALSFLTWGAFAGGAFPRACRLLHLKPAEPPEALGPIAAGSTKSAELLRSRSQ
jgi:hypothetical protein